MQAAQALICLAALLPGACAAGPGHGSSPGHDATQGTVTGRMVREGGPIGPGGQQPGTHPIPGTVRFMVGGHQVITVRTSQAGTRS